MTMLVHYDRAMAALAAALESNRFEVVLKSRDELDHIKLHARHVRDRVLVSRATEAQMQVERWLGVLLERATEAGMLRAPGQRGKAAGTDAMAPATLKEIGIDKKLSARARAAAALDDDAFAEVVAGMHSKMAAGKAMIVDPVNQAGKFAEQQARREAHAARTQNGGTVADLGRLAREGRKFTSMLLDPPWKFLTRSALGDGRSANVHYKTEEVDRIKDLPVEALAADDAAMYMWMVDWCPQDALDLIAHYGFKHITTAFTWVKTNGEGALDIWDNSTWHLGQGYWTRANPEQCWFATRGTPKRLYADVRQLVVAPLMDHSRKPDIHDRIERLTDGDYLELQARRTRAGWVSWGDELEFTGEAAA